MMPMRPQYGYNRYPATQNQPGQQQPGQGGFRQEYQGVIQGVQSLLTLSYSSIQMYSFGRIFVEMTKKLITFCRTSMTSLVQKVLALFQIKKILQGQIHMIDIIPQDLRLLKILQGILFVVILLISYLIAQIYRQLRSIQREQKKEKELQELAKEQESSVINKIQHEEFWQQPKPASSRVNYLDDLPTFSSNKPQLNQKQE